MSDTNTAEAGQQTIEDAAAGASDFKTDIAEYNETAAALARLEFRMKGVVYDLTTTKGMEAAKADRKELRTLYVTLDKKRLELNEDDQARIKRRNKEAERIDAAIRALFDPIDQQIKAEEQRKEDEKAEKARIERERVANLNTRIDTMKNFALRAVGKDAAYVREKIETLKGMATDDFEELTPIAVNAKADTLERLGELLTAAEAHERATAELAESQRREAAQRAENERLEREAQERRDAEAKAARARQEQADKEEQARQEKQRAAAAFREKVSDIVMGAIGQKAGEIEAAIFNLGKLTGEGRPEGQEAIDLVVAAKDKLEKMHRDTLRAEQLAALEERRQREKAEQERMARSEIDGIQQQAIIAQQGRLGVRAGGTIECIRETLAETEKWPIDDHFGDLREEAQRVKDETITSIRFMLARAEQAEADRVAEAERIEAQRLLDEKEQEERRKAALAMTELQKVAPGMYVLLTRFSVLMLDERMTQKKKLENLEVLRGQVLRLIGDMDPPHGTNSEYLSDFVENGDHEQAKPGA